MAAEVDHSKAGWADSTAELNDSQSSSQKGINLR
jgi:hypothetical protein